MYRKIALIVVAGILPLVALAAELTDGPGLRLKIICRSDAVVVLEKASLLEEGVSKDGSIPTPSGKNAKQVVRLNMADGGTLTIAWEEIVKIAVAERAQSENNYTIEVTLKNLKDTKVGKTYGNENTVVGLSDAGEFSIQLKDVKEIVALP